MNRKLYKSREYKTIAGVCGGLAEYFDIDVTIVRLIWVAFCLMGGSGILAYFIAALVIPEAPYSNRQNDSWNNNPNNGNEDNR